MSEEPALTDTYFLSYSRADERFALRFAKDLRANGVGIWVDQLDIHPSQHWDRAIERVVRECRGLVVILSPRAVASDNVADEISFAIDSGKSVLPVMIERCTLPLRITRMQIVDATGNYDKALQQCVAEIRRNAGNSDRDAELPSVPRRITDPEAIATAKARLASVLGPIAGMLVDKAAGRAGSVKDLYSLLSQHIDNEKVRERFITEAGGLATKPALAVSTETPTPGANLPSIEAAEVERMASVLTNFLGPIAAVVARRESAGATSPDDLQQRLASLIPDERERAEFIRRVQTH